MHHTLRNRLVAAIVFAMLFVSAPAPAHATSKEIIELQTQVQQLQDNVQRLQSTLDKGFAVLQHLAEQSADNSNQVTAAVTALQQKLNAQNDAVNGKLDAAASQTQSLNDSVDELKSRIAKLDKSVQDLQMQLQNIQAPAATQPAAAPSTAPAAGDTGAQPAPAPSETNPAGAQAPPLQDTFQAALRDYNAAKYELAGGEFQDVLHYYPLDDLAGQAQFYLGEIAYRQKKYSDAIGFYDAVLKGFSGCPRAPAAQLHKGLALLQLDKKQAGIDELRLLIRRHPQTPEAAQARSKLNGMGVRVVAAH